MSVTARSTPNIAFIKYWGNRSDELRLPMAPSLSMTLDRPTVEITVENADAFSVRSFLADGSEKTLKEKDTERFRKVIALMQRYLESLKLKSVPLEQLAITVRSHIPPAIGLASSAAVFSCLAKAVAGLVQDQSKLSDREVSILARLGSGSAARSIFGGFSTLEEGSGMEPGSSWSEQIADEKHWTLYDIVTIPAMEEKKVGSTEGHALASTSPFYADRVQAIRSSRQQECIDAIQKKDFEALQRVTEEDCLDMHHVMETSVPPLHYLNAETHRIVNAIKELRSKEHIPVLFTMDAGPTVHLVCPEEGRAAILSFAHAQKGCTIFETKVGPGASLIG
ncbi:MAG TPA: diphosphomevalonate decarboxylase [Candidatus Peribacter riflensis]|uniref:diphosphomevalonate decarboxylase n=1 Tax=Candidatus Peribacter riflensis TaxID=1735162 RepID=A0A0S1SYE4_9BACT|nr:MAG: diphosphomevalonate decarboxylase [Candidatus Peribacter riflensis]OGJ78358.1 MAG: diphosphomevalonate decarboxylase [Candidatus Peribacteria bacterium RIFOXYC1_FULL_58_8]OGJ78992.1 MAG: diphosphomevalonate decarboxylase [Candidatus Peribacteria bacterium RIFOXYB1_FULL_57_12]ALM11139.1 MAG: diphosphomevalonate decarboxylase [Candidatus Peribacter riflensis]ALM12242.1 MAG: diphosphomevalonate decarboxylase [Candidatus Peribacter riflensis]